VSGAVAYPVMIGMRVHGARGEDSMELLVGSCKTPELETRENESHANEY